MTTPLNEDLLRHIALVGEITGQDLARKVVRIRKDYTDFYGVAAMIHSGYIAANTAKGTSFGNDVRVTATMLCQLSLAKGESFTFNDCPRDSMWDFPIVFFITGEGVLKLEQLEEKRAAAIQKRNDYIVSALVAILAAALSTTATHFYSLNREVASKVVAPGKTVPESSSNPTSASKSLRGPT
jgi:hypothetical protein